MARFKTSLLEVDYRDEGPSGGPTVLLLHGWPDDASTWQAVASDLNALGFRTIAPNHRGFGASIFLDPATPRTANPARLAMDAMELIDGLGIERIMVAGHDWGSNTAEALAVGWPERIVRLAMLSTPSRLGGLKTPSFEQAQRYWYHWFQVTQRGAEAIAADPHGFAHLQWVNWSPRGWFSEKTFRNVAKSFDNPDWVEVTLHSYRSRWGEAQMDPSSQSLEDKINHGANVSTPTLFLQGEVDGVNPPSLSEDMAEKFSGPFQRLLLGGVGHFPTREAPHTVARHLAAHFGG